MLRTGVVLDPRYHDHQPGPGHPERPQRVGVLLAAVERCSRLALERVPPRAATRDDLELVHSPGHVDQVAATAGTPGDAFDADTPVSARSHETALLAVGGVLELVDAVLAGEVGNGLALVRPPGHHAEADRAMGFCLFNNVAVAAEHARRRHGLERVLVVDWDVHHGNGTQHAFADDAGLLYVSTHQYPFYPGTGAPEEVGSGQGAGFTVNLPLPAGCGDDEYLYLFEQVVDPVCRQYRPQLVLVSAGFDAHLRDPLGGMRVSTEGYGLMARVLLRVARDHAAGRLVAVLEGGYDLEALTASVERVLTEMAGDHLDEPLPRRGAPSAYLPRIRAAAGRFWELPEA